MSDFAFNPGDLGVGVADALAGGLGGDGVRLPFKAPFVWWKNGEKREQRGGGVPYFGGWAITADELVTIELAAPEGFKLDTWVGDNGEYEVWASRTVGIAPIAKRTKWVLNDKGDGRSKLHILAILGSWDADAKQYLAYGPAVISASGMATKYLMQALKKFEADTAAARKQYAGNLPASLFYAPVGTFGDAVFEMVGKENKSAITPPALGPIGDVTPQLLQALYIGANSANEAADYKQQAQEWLAAWPKSGKGKADTAPGGSYETESDGVPF